MRVHREDGSIAIGLGCERGTPPDEVLALAEQALASSGIAADRVVCVASIETRREEPAIVAVAKRFGVPLTVFTPDVLEQQTPRLENPSDRVFALTGCHGVAEAAALAAGGDTSLLIVPKSKSAHATAAVSAFDFSVGKHDVAAMYAHIESVSSSSESAVKRSAGREAAR